MSLKWIVGKRYASCKLDNYEAQTAEQISALDKLQAWVDRIHVHMDSGNGIFLFGPSGTGKDHLAVSIMRIAIGWGYSAEWINGLDLFGDLRDAMDGKASEAEFIDKLSRPDLLTISDPLPITGQLTSYQMSQLWRVLDRRYRACRPTIITLNVADRNEADERMGAPTVDRMIDGAMTIHCNWPSYRQPLSQKCPNSMNA